MEYEVTGRPSYSLLVVTLEAGEAIVAESGAMVSMSSNIEIVTMADGGLLGALKRKVLGGESFFMNTFVAQGGKGHVTFAPRMPGDIECRELPGQPLYIQSGSFLACAMSVELDTEWGGAKTFFMGEGLYLLKAGGEGPVFLASYGAIHQLDLEYDQKYIVDTGHVVAFEEMVDYKVKKAGNLKSFFFSGEGLVCEFTGPGTIYMQTRSDDAFLSWLAPRMSR